VITPKPVVLEGHGVRLEPLSEAHGDALIGAASDGRLWEFWFIAVPPPEGMKSYVADALKGQRDGHMLPWVVRDVPSGAIVGSTRYHDIVPAIDRVEIGHTWYGTSRQRTHVNTTCKLLLLGHAFDTLGCVSWSERARRELRASGESSRRRDPAARDQLTAQELQIAQLAGEGLSNREIGQRLYLSHRTISTHLYRIFPKLGITARGELVGALASGQSAG